MKKHNGKKRMIQILLMVMLSVLIFGIPAQASSAKSTYNKAVKFYKKGKYAKAQKLFDSLSSDANEKCVKKMSSGMKKAYRKIVNKYNVTGTKTSSTVYLWGYYLTDIDKDNKAELIIKYGTCEADVKVRIYTYKNGKATKVGDFYGFHSTFYYYPSGNGMVVFTGHMGYESIYTVKIKNGKVETGSSWRAKGRMISGENDDWLQLPYMLDSHVRYDSNYHSSLDLSPLT